MMSVPASAASAASSPGQLELALVVGALEVEAVRHALHAAGRRDLALGVAAGQPAAVERAPHEHAHAVALARRQQGAARSCGRRSSTAAARCGTARSRGGRRPSGPRRCSSAGYVEQPGVADLAGAHEVVERRQRVLDVGPRGRAGAPGRGRCGRCRGGAASPRPRGRSSAGCCRRRFGPSPIVPWNFVASTTSSRRPASALPTIVSDSPREYTSAVSMKLIPASRARWMIATLSSWSRLPIAPNIIAPRHSSLTLTPVFPNVLLRMVRP